MLRIPNAGLGLVLLSSDHSAGERKVCLLSSWQPFVNNGETRHLIRVDLTAVVWLSPESLGQLCWNLRNWMWGECEFEMRSSPFLNNRTIIYSWNVFHWLDQSYDDRNAARAHTTAFSLPFSLLFSLLFSLSFQRNLTCVLAKEGHSSLHTGMRILSNKTNKSQRKNDSVDLPFRFRRHTQVLPKVDYLIHGRRRCAHCESSCRTCLPVHNIDHKEESWVFVYIFGL